MSRHEDVSSAHFDWLVEARSQNQKATAWLYKLIERHVAFLETDFVFQEITQDLTAIAFSLWRAVFLSDASGEVGGQLADAQRFLRSLIAHNTVLYQTDFTSREWAFRYYLQNALFRLRHTASDGLEIFDIEALVDPTGSAKDDWAMAQAALDMAISNFAKAIDEHDKD